MAADHTSNQGPARQRAVYVAGVGGLRPAVPVASEALARAAEAAMTPEAWAYVAGGAGRESTVAANQAAFERWGIVPRVLRDAGQRDLSIELFGRRLPSPLLLAPIGVLELVHRDADLAVARAAAAHGVPCIFSNQASVPMETVAAAMGDAPRWFQLYWSKSNDLVRSLVQRAEACGCEAIVLTLDTTMLGWRPRDLDLAFLPFLRGQGIAQYTSDPVFLAEAKRLAGASLDDARGTGLQSPAASSDAPTDEAKPPLNLETILTALAQKANFPGGLLRNLTSPEPRAAVQHFVSTYSRPNLTWDDLKFLRGVTRLPVLLKGILHADDARKAIELGMDGIVVSNHGGRQVDGAIAALDALPAVVDAVNGRVPVLFDSGVRGGADLFKVLALGATAACLGRPYVYGLAAGGQQGVAEVIANVLAELDLTLGLAGCRTVGEITRDALSRETD